MPTLLLIRHGQASFGAADYDVLSALGTRQAAVTAAALRAQGVEPARLVSGSMRRQQDTAAAWEAVVQTDAGWNEYDSADVLGSHLAPGASLERPVGADGARLSSRDFQALLDGALHAWIAAGPNSAAAESWTAFRARCVAAMESAMHELAQGETGLAFTSGGVIAALAAAVLELPDSAMVNFNHVCVNGAVTKLVGGRRGISLISFNEHGHLNAERLITYR